MSYHQFSLHETKARKKHRCSWCGEPIPPGETYWREKSVYDGNFQNDAWHPECWEDFGQYCEGGETEWMLYSAPRPERGSNE